MVKSERGQLDLVGSMLALVSKVRDCCAEAGSTAQSTWMGGLWRATLYFVVQLGMAVEEAEIAK